MPLTLVLLHRPDGGGAIGAARYQHRNSRSNGISASSTQVLCLCSSTPAAPVQLRLTPLLTLAVVTERCRFQDAGGTASAVPSHRPRRA